MLKIYFTTITYELVAGDKKESLDSYQYYTIEEEQDAVSTTREFSAYSEEAAKVYLNGCDIYEKKKGRRAVYRGWPSDIWVSEWLEPDAKLIVCCSYKEKSCSMHELMKLDANDVIAYLKQEGLNLLIPS
jgi:hypothetical protein